MRNRLLKLMIIVAVVAAGAWLVGRGSAPAPESSARRAALSALAPGRPLGGQEPSAPVPDSGEVAFSSIDLAAVPVGADAANGLYARWRRGEVDITANEYMLPPAEIAKLQAEALRLPPSAAVQHAQTTPAEALASNAPVVGVNFPALDYTDTGGFVPPDPEIAAGPDHLIVGVNTVFAIYNKSGATLRAPTEFSALMGSNASCDSGLFDPNVIYDESADRFILGMDGAGDYYCLAVTATGNPLGTWRIYAVPTASGSNFFDYPHIGVGRDFLFMGGNIFLGAAFKEARLWAFEKADLYAGTTLSYFSKPLPISEDTPQPLHLHGWDQGTWPSGADHYFFTETDFNGATYSVWRWTNPATGSTPVKVGTVDLEDYTGVAAGMPIDAPQQGSAAKLQANDFRPHDFEYRDGFAWSAQTVACNPGGGTVNCLRWAKIDPATATVADAGVFASAGQHRLFGNLAVNACGDMAVGYTKTGGALYPAVYAAGRRAADPPGTLQAEVALRAGTIAYTAFDDSPHRWGDYTGMTIDPDGERFWYVGQYSSNTGTLNGRWATNVTELSFGDCGGGQEEGGIELSPRRPGAVDGVAFVPADIVAYDEATGQWSMRFDASDVKVSANVNAFARQERAGQPPIYYLVFAANQNVPGLGNVTPFDVVKFTPSQLGDTTAGTFAWYFDGSDVGLTKASEKIDALGLNSAELLISLTGAGAVPNGGGNLKAADEDILAFDPTSAGSNTAGSWRLYFDGSVAVNGLGAEDVNSFWNDPATGDLYLSLVGGFNVGGVSGNGNDVLKLSPAGGGAYDVALYFDADAAGFPAPVDALEIIP
jgi:hypothetical protein